MLNPYTTITNILGRVFAKRNTCEQHVAVFGESGSGKTVLLSSFYGWQQESEFLDQNLLRVIANDTTQGNRLHANYLGMKEENRVPAATKFSATSYAFSVKLRKNASDATKAPSEITKLVWHDYPGEWFTQETEDGEETSRKINAFRALLQSNVALLLVDGQKLKENAEQEDRYLKLLFTNIRNEILRRKDNLLVDGKPIVDYPRIWVLALSKSDLFLDKDVFWFRDLVINKALNELEQLKHAIGEIVVAREALSIGEDFLLLSSAKFEHSGKIDITQRCGLDLILPLALILPCERHLRWKKIGNTTGEVFEKLLRPIKDMSRLLTYSPVFNNTFRLIDDLVSFSREKLIEINEKATKEKDYISAILANFRLKLLDAEKEKIFHSGDQ
jgi:hypothetical protein